MLIGVLKEIKKNENRVALVPSNAEVLVKYGHTVLVQSDAGTDSGFDNEAYLKAGAEIVDTAAKVFGCAEMILKVKEPIPEEYGLIRAGQLLFTYFHFAASRQLTEAIIKTKCIALAYETVQLTDSSLPLLIPMSEVAGRMAPQQGAKYLERAMGGRGVLLGGIPGTPPAEVIVLGGGIVGMNAAKIAAGLGARGSILDSNLYRLRYLADVIIGSVLSPGAKAPHLISRDLLPTLKRGCVLVDVSIDQGGCFETSRPTTHEDPIYTLDGIVHYCVTNMPGAVPFTSTLGLTNATFPYTLALADQGFEKAIAESEELRRGLNIYKGEITYKAVAEAFDLPFVNSRRLIK